LKRLISTLKLITSEFGLIINPKKSGILPIKNCLDGKTEPIDDFPILKEYCYLGVNINGKGSLAPYLNRIRMRATYLQKNFSIIKKHISFKN